jgi:hypothetical protein
MPLVNITRSMRSGFAWQDANSASSGLNCVGAEDGGAKVSRQAIDEDRFIVAPSARDRALRMRHVKRQPWFIYIAHSQRGAVVKVGVTVDVARRTEGMRLHSWHLRGWGIGRGRTYRFALRYSWPLGDLTGAEAFAIEGRIHDTLKPHKAASGLREWYRARPSTVLACIKDSLGANPVVHDVRDVIGARGDMGKRRTKAA